MRPVLAALALLVLVLTSPATFLAQSAQPSSSSSTPRLISISGIFRPADGQPLVPVEAVTLAIYAEEAGGVPLWQETQSILVDSSGRYMLHLGATHADGVPVSLFAPDEPRWLGVTFARTGEIEAPRTRLTSVPYALRAAEADTLGGRPASDFVLAPTADAKGSTHPVQRDLLATAASSVALASGTTNFLSKFVNATDLENSTVYENLGFVGIGTTTPLDRLHVRVDNNTGDFTGYAVQNANAGALAYSGMLFYDHTGAIAQFQGFNNSTHEYRINNIARDSNSNFNGTMNFMIGSASRFFISSSGNIGIGTATPAARLEVCCSGDIATTVYNNSSSEIGAQVTGRRARGSVATPLAVVNGDLLAFFSGTGYFNGAPGGFQTSGKAGIQIRASESWSVGASGAYMDVVTTPTGSTTSEIRMRIDPFGFVGIGTGNAAPLDRLQVAGDIRVGLAGSNGCIKGFDGSLVAGACSSDRRFKKDVTAFNPVLRSLTALQPVHYYWRAAEFPERHFGDRRAYGLIAQDVERVLPELVVTNADGFKAVDYSKLPLLTLQAVRELKVENDLVKAKNEALQAANAAIAARSATLEARSATLEDRVIELERQMKELLATISRR